jgi:hypothetical protein
MLQTSRKPVSTYAVIIIALTNVMLFFTGCASQVRIGNITFGQQRTPRTVITVGNTEPVAHASGSENWAGYAVSGYNITTVSATWQVPQVTGDDGDSSTWVGIGGMSSPTLIQAGTDQQIQQGRAFYYVWIEMLPDPPEIIDEIDLLPGDYVTVTVTNIKGNDWEVVIHNQDSNQVVTKNINYKSCRCSAEWVEEIPSVKGQQTNLANFTSVTFTESTATINGQFGNPTNLHSHPIRMIDHDGNTLVQPQVLHEDTFSLVYLENTN